MRINCKNIFAAMCCCVLLSGCYPTASGPGTQTDNDIPAVPVTQVDRALLYGEWTISKAKFAPDATMTDWEFAQTTLTFKENGIYQGKGYYGNVDGIYTIQGAVITVLIENVSYVTYEVLAQGEDVLTLCATFTATAAKVWMQCTKHKEGYLEEPEEQQPQESFSEETLFQSPEMCQRAVLAAYSALSSYLKRQAQVQEYILSNQREYLQKDSEAVTRLWAAGYYTIRIANTIISALEKMDSLQDRDLFIAHARTIRAFVHYNMNVLWGGIPIVTTVLTDTTPEIVSSTELEVLYFVKDEFNDIRSIPEDRWNAYPYIFNNQSLTNFMIEVALAIEDYSTAKAFANELTQTVRGDFFVMEDNIIYSSDKLQLYLKEAKEEITGLSAAWMQLGPAYRYGCWAALKRIGAAQEVTGCDPSQLYLPPL